MNIPEESDYFNYFMSRYKSISDTTELSNNTNHHHNNKQRKNQTLESLHKQTIKTIDESDEMIQQNIIKRAELQTELTTLYEKGINALESSELLRLFSIEEQIETLTFEIEEYDKERMKIDYFIKTIDVLYPYYDNKENISNGNDYNRKRKAVTFSTNPLKPNSIIDFFNKRHIEQIDQKHQPSLTHPSQQLPFQSDKLDKSDIGREEENTELEETRYQPPSEECLEGGEGIGGNGDGGEGIGGNGDGGEECGSSSSSSEDMNGGAVEYVSRHKLLDNYLSRIEPQYLSEFIPEIDQDVCPVCHEERVLYPNEALIICSNEQCAYTEFILMDSNKPSFKDPPREMSFYSYKRINHFNEWLAQFQAKETTDISDDVYNKILLELKKERLSDMSRLTPQKIKDILKRLGYNKYYEHIPHIINRLNGLPAPVMLRETEEKLRSMFKEIQAPFIKHCPPHRKNFLSYAYVLFKFCQLLNLDEFLPCFPMLKSREKLHQQDMIWMKICCDVGWEFIKSV